MGPHSQMGGRMPVAFYDLAVSPVSFDFLHFVQCAAAWAKQLNHPLHVAIVPGPNEGFRIDHKPIDVHEKRWRIEHILVPACKAIGATYTLCPDRSFARMLCHQGCFPLGYTVDHPKKYYQMGYVMKAGAQMELPEFEPSERARRMVARYTKGMRGFFTVTQRNTHTATRNTSDDWDRLVFEWSECDVGVNRDALWPLVIPDTADAGMTVSGAHQITHIAAVDLDVRLALYDAAVLNLSSAGGPFMLNVLSRRRPYLWFYHFPEPYTDPAGRNHWVPTREKLAGWGLPEGSQTPWRQPNQEIVWAKDDYATLANHVLPRLEALKEAA